MVGIVMNARIQTQNEKEFRDLIHRMGTPNRAVDIKRTIENRAPKGEKIHHFDKEHKQCCNWFLSLVCF